MWIAISRALLKFAEALASVAAFTEAPLAASVFDAA